MSLVSSIRDYIDLINSNFDPVSAGTDLKLLVVPTLWYILGSLKYVAAYLLSFQWLRDLTQLPLLVPQLSLSILKGNCYPFETPVLNFFTFLENPDCKENRLLIGFLNSFFASLPITSAHILGGRRLLVQGIPAGVAAGSGIVFGQFWFLACVILGLRSFLLPWLALEPFNYLLGLGLLVSTVYRITHQRGIRVVKWTDRGELLRYFAISFLLTWCEQSSIFQYLGNLTVGAGPTALNALSSGKGSNPLLAEGGYLIGFLFGSCMFALLFGCAAIVLRRAWLQGWSITPSRLTNQLNRVFLVTLVAFSFASVPYYGIDYLFTNRLGFLPQDRALERTILSPSTIEDVTQNLGRMSNFKSFDTDVSTFDRGLYLQQHQAFPQSFEDLNYQGEYGWTKRISKAVKHMLRTKTSLGWHKLLGSEGTTSASQESTRKSNYNKADSFGMASAQHQPKDRASGEEGLGFDDHPSLQRGRGRLRPIRGEVRDELESHPLKEEGVLSKLLALENEIARPASSASLDDESNSDISSMAEALGEDSGIENEFLSLFDTGLSPLFIAQMPEPSLLQKTIKRRFVENPLYHLLLRLDIDSFLHRQPASHSLSPLEETTLFQKRQVIGHYYNTLRQYSRLQNWEDFQAHCHGSKSYANRVYNHQFKGTLKVVRRLFSITLDPEENADGNRVLKFDQPLFKDNGKERNSHSHEELASFGGHSTEESPFLEIADPKPFYAGWDEELRKLVVTNRSLPRSKALYESAGGPSHGIENQGREDIFFTAWPISERALARARSQSEVPYQVAFESSNDPKKERLAEVLHGFAEAQGQDAVGGSTWDMPRWPANLRLAGERPGPMPSTRGGFVWPGHSQLKIGKGGQNSTAK